MNPKIDATSFGSITVGGKRIPNDILINLAGDVAKRKKKLSKQVYGTSHTISIGEAKYVYEEGAEMLILGSGQTGLCHLSPEAEEFFRQANCEVRILPTKEAITAWNEAEGKVIGLFHVTC